MMDATQPHSRSIGWAVAMASLWGRADHENEWVVLTDEVPARLRFTRDGRSGKIVTDRQLALKTIRAGTHTMLRFDFGPGRQFFEVPVDGVSVVQHNEMVEIVSEQKWSR